MDLRLSFEAPVVGFGGQGGSPRCLRTPQAPRNPAVSAPGAEIYWIRYILCNRKWVQINPLAGTEHKGQYRYILIWTDREYTEPEAGFKKLDSSLKKLGFKKNIQFKIFILSYQSLQPMFENYWVRFYRDLNSIIKSLDPTLIRLTTIFMRNWLVNTMQTRHL